MLNFSDEFEFKNIYKPNSFVMFNDQLSQFAFGEFIVFYSNSLL